MQSHPCKQFPDCNKLLTGSESITEEKASNQEDDYQSITPRRMKDVFIRTGLGIDRSMLWAAATTTFYTFCRSGEVTVQKEDVYDPQVHLSYGDLQCDCPNHPSIISLLIKQSKTDQRRKGVKVYLGRTNDDMCHVTALLAYLKLRAASGPLFRWSNSRPLSRTRFAKK